MSDNGELLRIKQEIAIKEVKKLLGEKSVKNDGNIMDMLEITKDIKGNYYPEKAYELLFPSITKASTNTTLPYIKPSAKTNLPDIMVQSNKNAPNTNASRTSTKEKNTLLPAINLTSKSNHTQKTSTKTPPNKTQKKDGALKYERPKTEKQTLESQLPEYLNGANVDIIQRDGHCFFRSITHQLMQYRFIISNEYKVVRNLIADYIDKSVNITIDSINAESPGYSDKQAYTAAIRKSLWGGRLEIQAIHDGCLSSLTDGQAFKIIVYSVTPNGTIVLHPEFLYTTPNGEEEHVLKRWPIRLLFVGNNHFHRIYFNDLVRQTQNYPEETRNIGPNIGLPPSRLTTAQLKQMGLLVSSPRSNEWGSAQEEMEEQRQALAQFNKKNTLVTVDENSNEYINLLYENFSMPFMIMGYQNGEPNLLYKSVWVNSTIARGIPTYTGDIYIPLEADINNRQFTRYPNSTMLNVAGKTIVNISLHRWANIWDDDNNIPLGTINDTKDSGQKSLHIYMPVQNGVEEVIGTEGADFTSISLLEAPVLYMRHGERGMAFSPDTGVIALDDNVNPSSCTIHVTDPTDSRQLVLVLNFHRREQKPGGKSRRRNTRKPRRNQRRRTKRR